MAISERDKQTLRKQLSPEEITNRYQQAIKFFMDGYTSKEEYKIFVDMNIKRDLQAAAHAWLHMVIDFNEYYSIVEGIVGFNLIIVGAMEKNNKIKSNGEKI